MSSMDQTVPKKVLSLFSGESGENPFPLFAQMRVMGICYFDPVFDGWNRSSSLDGHAYGEGDAGTQRSCPLYCRSEHHRGPQQHQAIFSRQRIYLSASPSFLTNSMNSVDEPDHRRLRTLVSKAFTPRYMESLRPRVQEIADELLDRVQALGEMDLVKDYAYPLPINVICDMLGVPQADRAQIHIWSAAIAHGLGLEGKSQRSRSICEPSANTSCSLWPTKLSILLMT